MARSTWNDLVGAGEVGLRFLDDAAEGLEHLALLLQDRGHALVHRQAARGLVDHADPHLAEVALERPREDARRAR